MWAGGTVDMLAQGQTHGRERPVPGEARLRRAGRGMRSVCGVESGGGEDGRIRGCRRPSAYSLLPEGGGEPVPRAQSASRPPLSMRVPWRDCSRWSAHQSKGHGAVSPPGPTAGHGAVSCVPAERPLPVLA